MQECCADALASNGISWILGCEKGKTMCSEALKSSANVASLDEFECCIGPKLKNWPNNCSWLCQDLANNRGLPCG